MIKNILFDFDGVLVESVQVKTKAFEQLYLPYGKEIAARVVAHHEANGGVSRFEKFRLYSGEWLGEAADDTQIESLARKFSDLVLEAVVAADWVPGADVFLKQYASNYQAWIITGTPTEEIQIILNRRAISQHFIEAFGSPTKKPDWVAHIIQEYGILPKETVFIGDALSDYEAATAHQLNFILRETPENKQLFQDYSGPRIPNLLNLASELNKL